MVPARRRGLNCRSVVKRRTPRLFVGTLATIVGCAGLAAIPGAAAASCTVTVTLLGGKLLTLEVPQGVSIPAVPGAVSVSESCAAPAPPTTTSAPPPSRGGGSSGGPTSSGSGKGQKPTVNKKAPPVQAPGKKSGSQVGPTKIVPGTSTPPALVNTKGKPVLRSAGGVPTASNPTFSFALPGPAPLGVPNFFIDSFRIPPFLLPIYQAAGIEYDVPWQVLAAINEIETDYGRNLSVSSAGAVGWMQFMPATWKQYGIDATHSGVADPYNPVDAIFSAARYLHAAGASKNLQNAIFSYNHAGWYVQSVLLRAKLIGGMPDKLIGALTGLVEGHFPVAAKATYADDHVESVATRRVNGSANPAITIGSRPGGSNGVSIFANQGSPVIAVNDGKIVGVGTDPKLGQYIKLQDATGNTYTYAQLGSIPATYPVPKPVQISAADIATELSTAPAPIATPSAPATAGTQLSPSASAAPSKPARSPAKVTLPQKPATPASPAVASSSAPVKQRLFAYPSRRESYRAGGAQQLAQQSTQARISSFQNYFSDVVHLGAGQYTLQPLKPGAIVVAGTILGRIGPGDANKASHVLFQIQPAGKGAPQVDPKPILDGWKLLEATAVYRAAGLNPFFGPGAKNPTIGQVLLMSKEQLQQRILADPHVQIYACGRRDIQAGLVDRRVLGTLEFLSGSGLDATVSSLVCGNGTGRKASPTDAAGSTGSSVNITAINGIPMLGHQGSGSITDISIRRLLTLQGTFKPDQIISTMSYKGQNNTLALPDHKDRLQVEYTPVFGDNKKLSQQITGILQPGQWVKLIQRIGQIPEPVVSVTSSQYAVKAGR
jgi:hypothetical protein